MHCYRFVPDSNIDISGNVFARIVRNGIPDDGIHYFCRFWSRLGSLYFVGRDIKC
jgi:hypothetical protein